MVIFWFFKMDICKSCSIIMLQINKIFLTEVEHQNDGRMLCKSEGG